MQNLKRACVLKESSHRHKGKGDAWDSPGRRTEQENGLQSKPFGRPFGNREEMAQLLEMRRSMRSDGEMPRAGCRQAYDMNVIPR